MSWINRPFLTANRLISKTFAQGDLLQKLLAKAIAGTFGIRLLNIGLAYLVSLLLARILGADGYGSYIYGLSIVGFLQIPTMLGTNSLITREVSVYKTQEKWGLAKGITRWVKLNIILTSLLAPVITALVFWFYQDSFKVDSIKVIFLGLLVLPISNLLKISESQLRALGHIVKSQLPEVIIRPLIMICALVGSYFFWQDRVSSTAVMGYYLLATTVCLLMISWTIYRLTPQEITKSKPEYKRRFWFYEALPMLLIDSMYLINNQTDTLMLGVLTDSASVGIYSITNRGANLMNFILSVFNVSLAPTIASLHAAGEKQKLQRLVKKSANLVFLSSVPIALGLIVFGSWFLGIFGTEFVQGHTVLTILCLGKLVNASTGAVALLLNMTGYQKYTFIGVAISAVINVILNSLLIPQWGVEGAATATAISTIIWNVLLVIFVRQRLGINMNPLSKTRIN